MFSDNKKGKAPDLSNQQNRISQGTKLKGDITSEGGFRIDGQVEGIITSPNKIVIGKTGSIIGTLICNDADIEGKVEGKIEIKNLLSIKESAHIDGDVITGKLAVEPNATFNATCVMNGGKSTSSDVKAKTKQSA